MPNQQLAARRRERMKKKVELVRRAGLVPGVLYGPAVSGTQPVSVVEREFDRVYRHAGASTLVDLVVEDGPTRPVLIHDVQYDAMRRVPLHIDFLALDMKVELTLPVPLHLRGEAPAVQIHNGILTQLFTELEVRCLPDNIPHAIEVDISALTEIGAQLTAAELPLPAGVVLMSPPDELILKIEAPAVSEEPEATEASAAATDAESGERNEPNE